MKKDPIIDLITRALLEEKAENIVILEVAEITILADYFIIASGRSSIHVRSIAENVEKTLKDQDILPLRKEGQQEGKWIILDYNSAILHVFRQEERDYYQLEDLWGDARAISRLRGER